MSARPYRQSKRARKTGETRRRIVEAVVALHQELGPAGTTISAIAQRAGVQRLTVYRHFPDEAAVFVACTAHWMKQNPPPDPGLWRDIKDPVARAAAALRRLYAYYRRTRLMLHKAYRDIESTPALAGPFGEFEAWLDDVRDDLIRAWGARGARRKALRAVLRHAISFAAWESLTDWGLSDQRAVETLEKWLRAL